MQEKTHLERRDSQVVDRSSFGVGRENLRRFRLNDHFVVDEHVDSLPADVLAFVSDGNGNFTRDHVTTLYQLQFESSDVDRFNQSIPVVVINLEEPANDRVHQLTLNE